MNQQVTQGNGRPARGVPLWLMLAGFLALGLAGATALVGTIYYIKSDRLKLVRELEAATNAAQRHEIEAKQAAEQAKLVRARNGQEQVLAQVKAATNSLAPLLAGRQTLLAEATALRTNETGRTVARHPDLLRLARRCLESSLPELPPEPEIVTRLEAVRRIEQQVLEARGSAYEPAAELGVTVQNAVTWGDQGLLKLGRIREELQALVRESKIKFTSAPLTADSPILNEALARLAAEEAGGLLRQAEQTVASARTNAAVSRAEAEAEKIRAEARREADEIRAKLKEEQAAKEREFAEREAQLKVAETKTKVAVEEKNDEARKVELRRQAADPAVQVKLAPFTTPGYWQLDEMTLDKKPHSYTKLKSCGALEPTVKGGSTLAAIVSTSTDRVRPRWKINPSLYTRSPEAIERIKEAQQLLIELGPVLVELGQLQP